MSDPQPRVVCGHRETRITGTWECVAAYKHDHGHYYVRLVRTTEEKR